MSIDEEIKSRLAVIDENIEKILSLLEQKETEKDSQKSNWEAERNRWLESKVYGGL